MRSLNLIFVFLFLYFISAYTQDKNQDGYAAYPKTKEFQQSLTPEKIQEMLKAGNERFQNNFSEKRDNKSYVEQTSQGQYPWAIIHGCMDSRVPPETIFDVSIGDIFTNRLAGNVITKEVLGSMEYGCKVAGAKFILVLGHTSCGAVKGAIDKVELGNITELVTHINPAVEKTITEHPDEERTSKNHELVNLVVKENVELEIKQIIENSAILREMEEKGEIKIAGAVYDISTGKVIFLN